MLLTLLMPLEDQLSGARERLEANLRSGIDEVLQSVAKAEARLEKERARLEAERTSLEREKAAFAKDKLAERTRAEAEAARVAATQRGLSSKVKLDAAPAAGGWRICICTHAKNTSVSVSVPNRVERSLVE